MEFSKFAAIVKDNQNTIILLEGMRKLPDHDREKLVAVGRMLAEKFPYALFRTGNASGTDESFAQGVASVDAARLEYILPYAGHRKKNLMAGSRQISLADVPEAEAEAVASSLASSPEYTSLMGKRTVVPKLRAKANYILRDTVKVTGAPEQGFSPATIGLFYANPDDPMKGGTGHTIRVCREYGVPAVFQADWLLWADKKTT
jgi:hypothetical protein